MTLSALEVSQNKMESISKKIQFYHKYSFLFVWQTLPKRITESNRLWKYLPHYRKRLCQAKAIFEVRRSKYESDFSQYISN